MRRIEVGGNFGEFLCSRCYVLCFAIMFYVSKSFSGMSSHKHKHNITRQKLCVYVLCCVYDKNISVKTQYNQELHRNDLVAFIIILFSYSLY